MTVTRRGDLDPAAALFHSGGAPPLVVCPQSVAARLRRRLAGLATVLGGPSRLSMCWLTQTLADQGSAG
ncbi:MAG: hypothetical protein R2734_17900 [Nocardioides sp.]